MADQLCRDLNPWQPELIDRDTGNLLLRQFVHDRYRLEGATPLQHTFLEQLALLGRQLQHLDHRIQRLAPVSGTFAGHGQAEAGTVIGDDPPIPVEDQPTIGRNGLHVNTVVLRQRRVMLILHHLQVVHPRNQHSKHHQHHQSAHDYPPTHQFGILFVVFQGDRLGHPGLLLTSLVIRVP